MGLDERVEDACEAEDDGWDEKRGGESNGNGVAAEGLDGEAGKSDSSDGGDGDGVLEALEHIINGSEGLGDSLNIVNGNSESEQEVGAMADVSCSAALVGGAGEEKRGEDGDHDDIVGGGMGECCGASGARMSNEWDAEWLRLEGRKLRLATTRSFALIISRYLKYCALLLR